MLKKILIIIGTFLISTLLSIAEYNYFHVNQKAAFIILNVTALLFGLFLMYSAYILLKKHPKYKLLFYANAAIGFTMTSIHIQKLFIGICI